MSQISVNDRFVTFESKLELHLSCIFSLRFNLDADINKNNS